MNNRQEDERHLEDLLRRTRGQEAPGWLKQRIMQRVSECRPSLRHRLARWFFQPSALRFSPAGLISVAVIVCTAFWGGILAERHITAVDPQAAVTITAFDDNAAANYLIGRGLLAGDRRDEALVFFQKAAELQPETAEYGHWRGVAYWAMGQVELEKQSYIQTVQEHPDYVPSLLNLGHSYLESGNYTAALDYYRRVVQLDPHIFEALYNSALAYRMLNDKDNEKQALRQYLDSCRTGKWAYRAIDRLHQLEDFTFRSYRIGAYRLVLNVADLLQADPIIRQREAELLARAVSRTDRQELHIVVYNKEKKDLARQIAFELRDQLLGRLDPGHDSLIKVSWFDAAEPRSSESGENLQLSPSVLLFSSPITEQNRRDSI